MKDILKDIAIPYTEQRKDVIINFLEKNNIDYTLQLIEHKVKKYIPKDISDCIYSGLYNYYFDENELYDESDDLNYEDEIEEDIIEEELEYDIEIEYLYNIIVNISSAYNNSKDKILLSAHYDVVSGSSGANDNGSSISILLKIAKEFNHTDKPIQIVFFTGEERGGIGSTAYINEYLNDDKKKDEVTLVNLDVCGCGDRVVIVNNILNKNSITNNLYSYKSLYNILEAEHFPFSDASIFKSNNIGAYSISVFPQADIDILEGKQKGWFGKHIWQYMHNGLFDNISHINFSMMEIVYKYVVENLLY